MLDLLVPDWPAPASVRAVSTTRAGGVSSAPYNSLNLGLHVGDDPDRVLENRRRLRAHLPGEPVWLTQVHGTRIIELPGADLHPVPEADASWTRAPGQVCVIQTADCLPVLFCDTGGAVVAAAHAGWRGLLSGVLENSLAALACPPAQVLAWLGPAIGPQAFEVGVEVREAFVEADPDASGAFLPGDQGKWWADLFLLARQRLARCGVHCVYGGGVCTASDAQRFFSHRRDRVGGRQASLIWLTEA